jgi:hypothetical protein
VRSVWPAALGVLATACTREIVVGADPVDDAAVDAHPKDAAIDARPEDAGVLTPLVVPWSTGFEDGFADWSQPSDAGYCVELGGGSYAIVTTPVHSGKYAAAFTVDTSVFGPSQARCVREGVLPASAYYGAWYYVPEPVTTIGSQWNLFHFDGARAPDAAVTPLWDVSLNNLPDGALAPVVFDFFKTQLLDAGPAIPIATWFHLEFFFKRSDAGAGELKVFVDEALVFTLANVTTDDTLWGQWLVGSYASALFPGLVTLYVDDVTIGVSGP